MIEKSVNASCIWYSTLKTPYNASLETNISFIHFNQIGFVYENRQFIISITIGNNDRK